MYLSPAELTRTQLTALEHAFTTGRILLDTTERIAELGFRFGRAKLDQRARHAERLGNPDEAHRIAGEWIGENQSLAAAAGEDLLRTLVQGNQALIAASQAQLRALDETLLAGLNRDEQDTPPELGFAYGLVKRSIRRAEDALETFGSVVARSALAAEEQAEQVLNAVRLPVAPRKPRRKAA